MSLEKSVTKSLVQPNLIQSNTSNYLNKLTIKAFLHDTYANKTKNI